MTSCDGVRPLLGVLVLDRDSDEDRLLIQRHLAGCAACRDELAALRRLPRLLALVPLGDLDEHRHDAVRASDAALHRLLATAAVSRARRRWLIAAAAALLILFAGLGGIMLPSGSGSGTTEAPPPAAATWSPIGGTAPGIHASATLVAGDSGTAIDLQLGGVASGTTCHLVVVSTNGTSVTAMKWTVDYAGTAHVKGVTPTALDAIDHMTIVTSTGQMLARLYP